jgi:hypothetical protein
LVNDNSFLGHLLLQMSMKDGNMPDAIHVEILYLNTNKLEVSKSKHNTILLNLAFQGDAIIKLEHPAINPKIIRISRLHSSPFPKKGGFCISVEMHSRSRQVNNTDDELITIYSEDYMEYCFFDSKFHKQRRSIHNLSKSLTKVTTAH